MLMRIVCNYLSKLAEEFASMQTGTAFTPCTGGQHALLTCDVRGHVHDIDDPNLRPKNIEAFVKHLVDWGAVDARPVKTALV